MKLCDTQISLILYIIGFVQYDKEQFQFYMSSMFGKEYSEEEIKNMMNELKKDINIQRFR